MAKDITDKVVKDLMQLIKEYEALKETNRKLRAIQREYWTNQDNPLSKYIEETNGE